MNIHIANNEYTNAPLMVGDKLNPIIPKELKDFKILAISSIEKELTRKIEIGGNINKQFLQVFTLLFKMINLSGVDLSSLTDSEKAINGSFVALSEGEFSDDEKVSTLMTDLIEMIGYSSSLKMQIEKALTHEQVYVIASDI